MVAIIQNSDINKEIRILIKQKTDNSLFEVLFVNTLEPAAIFLDQATCKAKPQKIESFEQAFSVTKII